MIVIGITGTLGAGKGTIVDYLKEKGFVHFSARDFIVSKINEKGLEVNRDTMTSTANELRRLYGSDYIIDSLYKQAKELGQNCVIESVRSPKEIELLKRDKNSYLFAVDADINARYHRITERKSETDKVSFEKFQSDEQREMTTTDPNAQNLRACIDKADYLFKNDGTIEDLQQEVEKILIDIMPN